MAVKVTDHKGTALGDLDIMAVETIDVQNATQTEAVLATQTEAIKAMIPSVATLNEHIPAMQADLAKALDGERTRAMHAQEFGGRAGELKMPTDIREQMEKNPSAVTQWAQDIDPVEPEWHEQRATIHRYQKAATAVSLYFNMLRRRDDIRGQKLAPQFLKSPAWKSFLKLTADTFGLDAKVLYTGGVGRGAEWVAAEMWGQGLIDRVRDASFLAPLMRPITMGHSTWKRPRIRGSHTWFFVPEVSTDLDSATPPVPAVTVTPTRIQTDNATWVAGKMGGYTVWSAEQALFQVLSDMTEVLDDFLRSGADAQDEALLYGDRPGTFHTGLDANDRRRTFSGLSTIANTAGYGVSNAGRNISWRDFGKQLGRMDAAAGNQNTTTNTGSNNTIFITPYLLLYHLMYEINEFIIQNVAGDENVGGYGFVSPLLTRNTYGEGNAVTSGEAAQVFGRPIFPTQFIPKTLDATGAIATASNLTASFAVNAGLFGFGIARDMELMILTELFATSDAVGAVAFWMGDLQPMVNIADHRAVDYLYNISTADPTP